MKFLGKAFLSILFLGGITAFAAQEPRQFQVGVAKVDVTPAEPIRLTGYAGRNTNSAGVQQKLWAKAVAIGNDVKSASLLMTLDNCGIAEGTYRELLSRLAEHGVKQEQLAICLSHTHSGPCTTDWAPNIFAKDIPAEQQATIDRYTQGLIDKLEKVATDALKEVAPAQICWSRGKVEFARNRRTTGGPVDHDLPVLKITDLNGKTRALVANYACHCTTLGGEFNHVHGDWAGSAQEALESQHPGATALVIIGCGADSNPHPRGGKDGGLALANEHGKSLAAKIKQMLEFTFRPLTEPLTPRVKEIRLPFDTHFTREQWEARAKEQGIVGYHAKKYLARLDRGEKLPADLYYPIVTWHFGDDLGFVFLPGEVVVDYSLRLKKELNGEKLWITAYANYVPCYIPSRRILKEGGYEAEGSLWYYDRPARLAPATEDLIIKTVHELLPKTYKVDEKRAEMPPPRSPAQSLGAIRTHADLEVELAVAEPLVQSPVWIDWSADGRLWVCEMYDYPTGLDGNYKPGGRIKVLSDKDGSGRYETASVFLDGLAFPTGVMPWNKGAFICAAPDILYAEDTDGDGRADLVRTNFTGFATHNYQARVNGLAWGLDGWIYGSSSLFGGKIRRPSTAKTVDLGARDFRFRPETGEIEPAAGLSQQGRIRDDFGNWFGNDNSTLLWHYPLAEHYMRRNPDVTYPDPRVNVSSGVPDATRLFPISRTMERFNDPEMADRVTGACGPEIYRDDLMGSNYYGNVFVCEPVHNLVTRRILEPNGVTFRARRATNELTSEFLASTDNWFRPVQARTGPDGALWIVDMYRFVIEHPRWIPTNRLRELDVRAGADMGRIYRVFRRGTKPRPIQDLAHISNLKLAGALNTMNGPTRDLIHQELVTRRAVRNSAPWPRQPGALTQGVEGILTSIVKDTTFHGARVQAIWALPELYPWGLTSPHPGVRKQALNVAETDLVRNFGDRRRVEALSSDDDVAVRFQLALSVGASGGAPYGNVLSELIREPDKWLQAAVLSSARIAPMDLLQAVMNADIPGPRRSELVKSLLATAFSSASKLQLDRLIGMFVPLDPNPPSTEALQHLAALLELMERKTFPLSFVENAYPDLQPRVERIRQIASAARRSVADSALPAEERCAGVRFYGLESFATPDDIPVLADVLIAADTTTQAAIFNVLRSKRDGSVAEVLLKKWPIAPLDLRGRIISLLLTRDNWALGLARALEQDVVSVAEIPASVRAQLSAHKSVDVRNLAAKLFEARAGGDRAAALSGYKEVASLSGRIDNGAEVFEKNCATCHAFRARGHTVGPNLAEFAGKSVEDFVVAILDPNAAIEPKHVAYNVELRDGRSSMGIIRGETASSLTMVQGGGVTETIMRSDIKTLRASTLSLMPEGLEQSISPQDMADLIGWLKQTAPARFGSGPPERTARARSDFVDANARAGLRVVRASETLDYPSWMGRLPLAHCRQTDGRSSVVWKASPIAVSNSVARFRFPAAMGLLSQPPGKFSLRSGRQHLADFNVALIDATWERPDGKFRMSYAIHEANSEDSNGVLTLEVAADLLDSPSAASFEVTGSPSGSQRWFGIYLP